MGFDILEIACEDPALLNIAEIKQILIDKSFGRHHLRRIWTGPQPLQPESRFRGKRQKLYPLADRCRS